MTRKNLTYIIALLAVVINTSCNSDLFIDDIDLPYMTEVTIEGDGGQWSTSLSRKGLSNISIDYSANDSEYVRYYGMDGSEVDVDCPASDLGNIVYENPKTYYSVGFLGDMIYITSYYNATSFESFTIRFDYDYGVTKYINVTLTEGEKLQQRSWNPNGDLKLEENIHTSTHTITMNNKSSLTQKIIIYPFRDSRCSDIVMPSDYWAEGLVVDLPMLAYNGKNWEWQEYKDITLGKRRDFTLEQTFGNEITVEVPAYTTVKVSLRLNYTRATEEGTISFFNSVDKRDFETPVTWKSVYATSYEYKVEYE